MSEQLQIRSFFTSFTITAHICSNRCMRASSAFLIPSDQRFFKNRFVLALDLPSTVTQTVCDARTHSGIVCVAETGVADSIP
jgi:hypothetical protein